MYEIILRKYSAGFLLKSAPEDLLFLWRAFVDWRNRPLLINARNQCSVSRKKVLDAFTRRKPGDDRSACRSDESAVYPAALVEAGRVDPCVRGDGCFVEVIVSDCCITHDLDRIAVVELADLVRCIVAGIGAEGKPSGIQAMDGSPGTFIQADLTSMPPVTCARSSLLIFLFSFIMILISFLF